MEINRNQYFMIGLVVLLLGIQFRRVETYVLTPDASRFIAQRLKQVRGGSADEYMPSLMSESVVSTREVKPPKWLGWFMLSVGGVLMLHSLAMPRPG